MVHGKFVDTFAASGNFTSSGVDFSADLTAAEKTHVTDQTNNEKLARESCFIE